MIISKYNDRRKELTVLLIVACLFSCQKKDINFGNEALTQDPNILSIDTLSVQASTFQIDSFLSKNTGYFVAGKHYDTTFGNFQSTAYFDLDVPYDSSSKLKNCTGCYFDSLTAIVRFTGGYYGDTTAPYSLSLNQLYQTITTDSGYGYNTTNLSYNQNALGSFSGVVSPSKQGTIRIKLSDELGNNLFDKIQRNSDTVTSSDLFLNYIKGFCFSTNSPDNTVYYFKPVEDSDFIILYYHKNAPLPQSYFVKFPLNTSHQFNGYKTNYTGTNLELFTPKQTLTLSSVQTNGFIYLYANGGLYPKFNFPSVYSLKELNSYISVINATLEIYPLKGSYGYHSFYTLPPVLNAYIINQYGNTQGYVTNSTTSELQTGNLLIDYIYNENTKYTYDVTSYINSVLKQGKYSSLFLFLQPPSNAADSLAHRLILNNDSFKLKLSVLGL